MSTNSIGLTEVPATWTVARVKFLFNREQRIVRENDEIVTAFRDGQVTLRRNRRIEGFTNSVKEIGYQGIRSGDLVVHAMDAFAGAIGVSDSDGKATPVYSVCTPRRPDVFTPYYARLLRHMALSGFVESLSKGIRERSTEFRWAELAEVELPVPPKPEQQRIAKFIDEQTARIDALIAEKERLLATLEEWSAAELARICFGTDRPTVATANAWITALPKGWKLMRLKHLVVGIEQGWSPECEARLADDDEWGVLKAGAANGGRFRETEHKALPATLRPIPELEVRAGDVLITRASGSADLVGSFAYVYSTRPKLMLSDKNFRLRFSENPVMLPELLAWMCNTRAVREQVLQYVSGADGLAKNIGSGSLRELWLAVPPQHEQVGLVEKLHVTRHQLDSLKEHLVTHIDRLREYRAALISAAVTGQLDINSYKEAA